MALVYRTSSVANVGPSTIKNSALTYEEGDGNFAYLLTNMSGSSVSIEGNTTLTGQLQVDGQLFLPEITSQSQDHILTYNTSSGRLYFTASSAIGGGGGGGSTLPGGLDTQIQFNSSSQFSGSAAFRYIYASQSLEQGNSTTASGQFSHAEGGFTRAIGAGSHAEGYQTQAVGDLSHAEGSYTQAIGQYSHAEGFNTKATGVYSHTEGNTTITSGSYSHAEGSNTKALGTGSHAEGSATRTGIQNAYLATITNGVVTLSADYGDVTSIEEGCNISGDYLYVYDINQTYADRATYRIIDSYYSAPNTIILLDNPYVDAYPAHVFWTGCRNGDKTIPGNHSHTEGLNALAIGNYSHAEGSGTEAIGDSSHAEGCLTKAIGLYSHAQGGNTIAKGENSHAQGSQTIAIGYSSHAEGQSTTTGIYTAYSSSIKSGIVTMSAHYGNVTSSFGIGNTMIASISTGEYPYYTISQSYYQAPNTIVKLYDTSLTVPDYHSVVVGDINYIDSWTGDQKIDAQGSHTEGYNTRTLGIMSHAEGVFTQALGDFSHAEGLYTKALGYASHAEGYNTIAFGSGSHAEGLQTNAIGIHSHAAGYATIASGSYQSVIGQYNVSSSAQSAFIIGNGTADGNRSNLVFASGSQVQITGSVLITQALTLPSQNPLPTVPAGSIAVSGSGVNMRPYFYNGSTWTPFY